MNFEQKHLILQLTFANFIIVLILECETYSNPRMWMWLFDNFEEHARNNESLEEKKRSFMCGDFFWVLHTRKFNGDFFWYPLRFSRALFIFNFTLPLLKWRTLYKWEILKTSLTTYLANTVGYESSEPISGQVFYIIQRSRRPLVRPYMALANGEQQKIYKKPLTRILTSLFCFFRFS
jgi:hypothetical protein